MRSKKRLIVFLVSLVSFLVEYLTPFLIVASFIDGYMLIASTDAILTSSLFKPRYSSLSFRSEDWTVESDVWVKTMRHRPYRLETELILIPRDFYLIHKFQTLTEYVKFVNGIEFITTFSSNIILLTSQHVPSCTAKHLSSSLTKIVGLYSRRGFIVLFFLMDMEFKKI